jgi:hypothetical protein
VVSKTDEAESAMSVNRKNAGTDLDEENCVDAAVVLGPVNLLEPFVQLIVMPVGLTRW